MPAAIARRVQVTLIGSVVRIPEPDLVAARTVYVTGYPDSKYWLISRISSSTNGCIGRLLRRRLRCDGMGGCLGVLQAHPDPLSEHKNEIMQHMNADHGDALILLAKQFAASRRSRRR